MKPSDRRPGESEAAYNRRAFSEEVAAYHAKCEQEWRQEREGNWTAVEYEDEEIPDDRRFTLPGYDPDDFTDLD